MVTTNFKVSATDLFAKPTADTFKSYIDYCHAAAFEGAHDSIKERDINHRAGTTIIETLIVCPWS